MFRSLSGFKAQYHYLTLLVISEFNEWRILVHGPGVSIHGVRQFSEAKAKEHAVAVARAYIQDRKQENLPDMEPGWEAAAADDWLVWRPGADAGLGDSAVIKEAAR
jgi:hypothetical protein